MRIKAGETRRKPVSELTLEHISVDRCIALRRNPQLVAPAQMEAMKASIRKDGFLAPVLLRPMVDGDDYEVVSGNHRVMAARELGLETVPALVGEFTDDQLGRIAVNMNTIHGEPDVDLLTEYLADLDNEVLALVHLDKELMKAIGGVDAELAQHIKQLQAENEPPSDKPEPDCVCPDCNRPHVSKRLD